MHSRENSLAYPRPVAIVIEALTLNRCLFLLALYLISLWEPAANSVIFKPCECLAPGLHPPGYPLMKKGRRMVACG